MPWRNAKALLTLRAEYDRAYPNRDRASDGTIGDAAHRTEGSASDHNPWIKDRDGIGVVRAFDFDSGSGLYPSETQDTPGDTLLQAALAAARRGHPAMNTGSYIIYERGLYSATNGWNRHQYTGSSPHEEHIHISVSRTQTGYDSTQPWGLTATKAATAPTKALPAVQESVIHPGSRHPQVGYVQRALNKVLGTNLAIDGIYGPATTAAALTWQTQLYGHGQGVDGDLGTDSLTRLAQQSGLFRIT